MANPLYDPIIQRFARQHGVDENLIRKIIEAESSWNPQAIGQAGERGLMQLMPETATEMGITDPFDPEQNIGAGTGYLKKMLDAFGGDTRKALAAYNFGIGNVRAGKPWPASTNSYISRILGAGTPLPSPGVNLSPLDRQLPPATDVAALPTTPNPQPAPPPGPMPRLEGGFMPDALRGIGSTLRTGLEGIGSTVAGTGAEVFERGKVAFDPSRAVGAAAELFERGQGAFNRALSPMTGPVTANAAPMPTMPRGDYKGPTEYPAPITELDPEAVGSPDAMARALRADPSVLDMLMEHLQSTPNPEDYKLSIGGKILGALGAGAAGAIGGPEAAIGTAEHFRSAPYQRALTAHQARGETLGTMAKYEDALSDRRLREREVSSQESYRNRMAGAAETRANRYTRGGAQKPVPVGQQDQAWQMAAERLYATDPTIRKYLNVTQTKNGPVFTPAEEYARDYWFDRDFTDPEMMELKQALAKIDQEAQKYIRTMVDPYDRSMEGFGVEP